MMRCTGSHRAIQSEGVCRGGLNSHPSRGRPQSAPEALPYPILRCMSSTSPRHAATRSCTLYDKQGPCFNALLTVHPHAGLAAANAGQCTVTTLAENA